VRKQNASKLTPTRQHAEFALRVSACAKDSKPRFLQGASLIINAIVLITVDRGRVNDVAQQLVALNGVTEVFSVAGRYDLVAVLRSPSSQRIADLVTRDIMAISYIANTETLLAFQVFSKYDLEAMFSIGLD